MMTGLANVDGSYKGGLVESIDFKCAKFLFRLNETKTHLLIRGPIADLLL